MKRPGQLLGIAGLLWVLPLGAQSPIGDPFLAHPVDRNLHLYHSQTLLANGDLLVAWQESRNFDDLEPVIFRARRFSLHQEPTEVMTLAEGVLGTDYIFNQLAAPRSDGGFLLTFVRSNSDASSYGCHAIPFNNAGHPLAREVEFAPSGGCGLGLVALADGTFGTVWLTEGDPTRRPLLYRMFARISASGELISRPRRINPEPQRNDASVGALGGNAQGEMTLIWDNYPSEARSFNAYGGALPPLYSVSFTDSQFPTVAVLPNGNRIFAGVNGRGRARNYAVYQRFAADGKPLGPLRPAHPKRDELVGDPVVAADPSGNFVIAWASLPGTSCHRMEARLFRADGRPAGKEFYPSLVKDCDVRPQVSFGKDGTFALTWIDRSGISVAWYSASLADEPCLTRGGQLLCDTGRTGGLPEIDQPVDRPETPLEFDALFLADADGDGRADPCYRFGTTFRCDLGHRGHGPRADVSFGEASDRPLMGDVDGDGRAEACVRRGNLLACDTSHDGGAAELEIRFGNPDANPLLGDLDGDGRDDLCLFYEGAFACDLAHDGGAPEKTILFGRAGDLPGLGDFDGDGRDDPCILRGQSLRCDTKHDGGRAEGFLALHVQPGDGLLMGNLDGL